MSARRVFAIGTLLASLTSAGLAAGEGWQVSVSPSYSSGDYGGETDARFLYVPLTVRYTFSRGDVSLIVPYLDLQGDGGVTFFGSRPGRTSTTPSRPTAAPTRPAVGTGRPPTPVTPAPTPAPVTTEVTVVEARERGLGDVGVRARFHVLEHRGAWPLLSATVRVNAPTGDPKTGTGYGAASGTVGLEISKSLGRRFFLLGDISYTRTGSSEDYGVLERWEFDVGLGASLSRQLVLSAYFEEWSQPTPGLPQARDALVSLGYALRPTLRLNVGVQIPLSDSAPHLGLVGGLGVRF